LLLFDNDDPARPVIVDVVIAAPDEPATEPIFEADRARRNSEDREQSPSPSATLATILRIEAGLVVIDADERGEVVARSAIVLRNLKDPVVVLTVTGHPPVIIGQLYEDVLLQPGTADGANILLKGRRVTIEADTELLLKAGGSVLQLDARGKVSTTGEHIVSRARGTNRVQGGSIHLN
jgi:hypothetical protein